jgi:hypothetical protein
MSTPTSNGHVQLSSATTDKKLKDFNRKEVINYYSNKKC